MLSGITPSQVKELVTELVKELVKRLICCNK